MVKEKLWLKSQVCMKNIAHERTVWSVMLAFFFFRIMGNKYLCHCSYWPSLCHKEDMAEAQMWLKGLWKKIPKWCTSQWGACFCLKFCSTPFIHNFHLVLNLQLKSAFGGCSSCFHSGVVFKLSWIQQNTHQHFDSLNESNSTE